MMKVLPLLALGLLLAAPALAVDTDQNALEDAIIGLGGAEYRDEGDIAIVDTGDNSVGDMASRLNGIGYTPTLIALDSPLDILMEYCLVILPVSHAAMPHYGTLSALAGDYHDYVELGGGLLVYQPNPYDHPGDVADIPWVPYQLTLNAGYSAADCPAVVVDFDHCITDGITAGFDFPGDTVVSMDTQYTVLVVGGVSQAPGVFVAEFGLGKVTVVLGNPNPGAICSPSDQALQRYVECTWCTEPTASQEDTWSAVKSLFN